MTIIFIDETTPHLTALIHRLEQDYDVRHLTDTVADAMILLQECADRAIIETLAMVHDLRLSDMEPEPQFGFHLPGPITPRIVDNAERSGAYQCNYLARVYWQGNSHKSGPAI